VKNRSNLVRLALGLALTAGSTGAWAQKTVNHRPDPEPSSEAELPDMNAIEKGATAPASLSFRPGQVTSLKTLTQSKEEDAKDEGQIRQLEGAASELAPPGGLFGVEGSRTTGGDYQGPGDAIPEFHVVKKGDTLWSLCDGYFKDPWRWPRLWAQNPLITNPHWIFPGDVVRMHGPGAVEAPVASSSGPGNGVSISRTRQPALRDNALVLREVGFVSARDLDISAVISGSREEKIMLSSGDQAYLSFGKDRPLRAGERYSVFVADTKNPVRGGDGAPLGYLVRIYGDVVIDQIADGSSARGTLVDMTEPAERGYLVSPQVRQFRRIEPRPSAVNLETRIVAAFSPTNMLASETFVVLSRGKKDGVEIGNRTFVVRRSDGYRRLMEGWDNYDPQYPNEVVGELWVVDVRDNTSLAWIARTSKEIRVGETAEMRKGH
jgi:hypothetical protein